jgi:hypothetical protein
MANGRLITRSVGFAVLRVDQHFTIDEAWPITPSLKAILNPRVIDFSVLTVAS